MCGIAGIISSDPSIISAEVLRQMAGSVSHRGPDGEAVWVNPSGNAGLGHRRLTIIDKSDAAAQPMHYLDRYSIVYNGEIYNYIELKETLRKKGYEFQTASDTEVILAAYSFYKEACVQYFDGMFAFAIWDEQEQSLYCARDRFGEKPFFYFYDETIPAFYFGSEMKVLKAAGIQSDINKHLLLQYLANGYTADMSDPERTFYQKFKKIPAAHYLQFSLRLARADTTRYWDIDPSGSIKITEKKALEQFGELLSGSVKRRLRSDVSVGASLSGGIDSSSIVSLITGLTENSSINTFTAIFPGFEKDEAGRAAEISSRLKMTNHTVAPSALEMINDFEKLLYHQEEPFSSASVYAQYKVFELAKKQGVQVLMDGQGADETLAGYNKYRAWPLRALFPRYTAEKLRQIEINALQANGDLQADFVRYARDDSRSIKPVIRELNDMLYFDCFRYGLEELLRYADRNSMAHGREVRLPFLNHELVSFVFSLPTRYKLHHGSTKWILRKAMEAVLPLNIVWNKNKIGFEPPQKSWMQHAQVREKIYEAKKGLVLRNILNASVLQSLPVAHNAYEKKSFEWRYLVAGSLFR